MDWTFTLETFISLVSAIPLTLQLAATSIAARRDSGPRLWPSLRLSGHPRSATGWPGSMSSCFAARRCWCRSSSSITASASFRQSDTAILWPLLREPYWCAVIGADAEHRRLCQRDHPRRPACRCRIGQIEAARACGMPRFMLFRRIVLPLGVRQALPGYGNEMISMVKATSLASIITLMEVTGRCRANHLGDLPRHRGLHRRRRHLPHHQFPAHAAGACSSNYMLSPHLRGSRDC